LGAARVGDQHRGIERKRFVLAAGEALPAAGRDHAGPGAVLGGADQGAGVGLAVDSGSDFSGGAGDLALGVGGQADADVGARDADGERGGGAARIEVAHAHGVAAGARRGGGVGHAALDGGEIQDKGGGRAGGGVGGGG